MLENIRSDARIPLFIGIVCIVLLAGIALFWVLRKDYQPLFVDISPEDAAAMANQLDKIEALYRINNETGIIEVPAKNVQSTRLKLMGSDVSIVGGVGYEVFDNSDFGMTEFAQKINYQRALEGELQRTISALEQVKHARVHLVMPDRALFRDADQEPTASVTLLIQDGSALNGEQITGIQRLVSASVPKLKETMVTISDHHGNTLTQPMPLDKSVQMVPWQLQQKMNAERYLAEKIDNVLSKAFDVGQLSISVDIIMDFSQVRKTKEQVIPVADGRAISKEKESRLGQAGTKKGGSNVTREVEYKMGRSVAEIVESPGRIKKINIGVMLPANLSDSKQLELQRLIEVTAGIDKTRGDSVAVYAYDLPKTIAELTSEGSQQVSTTQLVMPNLLPEISKDDKSEVNLLQSLLNHYWPYLIVLLIAIFALAFLMARLLDRDKKIQLSPDEREKVLLQLQHWLGEAK